MARDVQVDFSTVDQIFPGIVEVGLFRVSIPSSGLPDQDVEFAPVTFLQVPVGDFIARVVRLDAAGAELGAAAVAAFTVPAEDTTMVAIAGTVFVTVS